MHRLLYQVLIVVIVLCGCGGLFFRRNPDLISVEADSQNGASCPTWSISGRSIYFISTRHRGGGALCSIAADGSNERILLEGNFSSPCVSPSGTRLALVSLATESRELGGRLLLVDTLGTILDTLTAEVDSVVAARFGATDGALYYYVHRKGIVRLDLVSRNAEEVLTIDLTFRQLFDVSGDTLLAVPGFIYRIATGEREPIDTLWQPRFCPGDPTMLAGAPQNRDGFLTDLVLVKRGSGVIQPLEANPYYESDIVDPEWSRDSERLIFCAARLARGFFFEPPAIEGTYGIWLLDR